MTERSYAYDDDPRAELAPLVPAAARRILDVGCGRGTFGAGLLAHRPGAEVWGIEPSEEAASIAQERLAGAVCGLFPDDLPADWRAFDCVTFNDVLEHLVDPWQALRDTAPLLAPGGTVFAAIPNVRYAPVALGLTLRGRWRYEDTGILDRTHLRFFTRQTCLDLFAESGYEVLSVQAAGVMPKGRWLNDLLGHRLDGLVSTHNCLVARPR